MEKEVACTLVEVHCTDDKAKSELIKLVSESTVILRMKGGFLVNTYDFIKKSLEMVSGLKLDSFSKGLSLRQVRTILEYAGSENINAVTPEQYRELSKLVDDAFANLQK